MLKRFPLIIKILPPMDFDFDITNPASKAAFGAINHSLASEDTARENIWTSCALLAQKRCDTWTVVHMLAKYLHSCSAVFTFNVTMTCPCCCCCCSFSKGNLATSRAKVTSASRSLPSQLNPGRSKVKVISPLRIPLFNYTSIKSCTPQNKSILLLSIQLLS